MYRIIYRRGSILKQAVINKINHVGLVPRDLSISLSDIFNFPTIDGRIIINIDKDIKEPKVAFTPDNSGLIGQITIGNIQEIDWNKLEDKVYNAYILGITKLGNFSLDAIEKSTISTREENLDWYTTKLNNFFSSYKIGVLKVIPLNVGPRIIRFELYIEQGKYISGPKSVEKEIALTLGVDAVSVVFTRGRLYLDVPRNSYDIIRLVDILSAKEMKNSSANLPIPLGIKPDGNLLVQDLTELPHMLIGGASGSGKSMYLHSVICSLMYKFSPEEVQFLLIDTKRIEFSFYKHFPYGEIYTDVEQIEEVFSNLVVEMMERYELFEQEQVRSIEESSLNYKIVIIDEISDLISQASKDFMKDLLSLLRKARAVGIHFICATQRPSADVIPGDIKANMPGRLAFRVASAVDSTVIIGSGGAEKLLGSGDGLFKFKKSASRIQSCLITVKEIKNILRQF